jgi:hypothetical protein
MRKLLIGLFLAAAFCSAAIADMIDGPPASLKGTLIRSINSVCSLSPSSCASLFGGYSVLWFGADKTGKANSTAAMRSAVTTACPTAGPIGQVYIPGGSYEIGGGFNLTGLTGGCRVHGDGEAATILKITSSTNAMVDVTGSASLALTDMQLNANGGTPANYGLLVASTAGQGCNVMDFSNLSITGSWAQAGLYIYGCSDSKFTMSQVSNFNTSAVAVTYISTTNALSAASSFTTINTGAVPSGDWNFFSFEMHDLSTFISNTHSTVTPLIISGASSPIKFYGGVTAGAPTGNNGYVQFVGSVNNVAFIGQQFYADNGQSAPFCFYNSGTTVQGITLKNSNCIVTSGVFAVANSTVWADMDITGNAPMGVPMFFPLTSNSGSVIRSFIDAQGQAINLGATGSFTHSFCTQPGTITASTNTATCN